MSGNTAIVVSGMHRSGTSVLTRVLSLLGAQLPAHLAPAREEKGDDPYWESQAVVDLNQQLLAEAGAWWAGWRLVDEEALADRGPWLERARDVVRAEYAGAPCIVLKDPRVSRLLPLWTEALRAEGYDVGHVIAVRHPALVAGSLERRDGLSLQASALGWLAHTLDAERFTRGERRIVVSLAELGADWRAQARRISAALDLTWEVDARVEGIVDALVDRGRSGGDPAPVALIDPVVQVFERWARDEPAAGDTAVLERFAACFAPLRVKPSATVAIERLQAAQEGQRPVSFEALYAGFNTEAETAWQALASILEHSSPATLGVPQGGADRAAPSQEVRPRRRPLWRRTGGASSSAADPEQAEERAPQQGARAREQRPHAAPTRAQPSTNLGPVADRIVARLAGNQRRRGASAEYDLLRDNFDLMQFVLQTPDVREAERADPIDFYLTRDHRARSSPDVNFSMKEYVERHPHRATGVYRNPYLEWLRQGRRAGEIADPAPGLTAMSEVLGRSEADVARELAGLRTDLRDRLRTGTLGAMLARAAEIEPLIGKAWPATASPRMYPFISSAVSGMVQVIKNCQERAGGRPARLVLVCIQPRWGGGRRAEGHIAHGAAQGIPPDEIVVVYTDRSAPTPVGRFPEGVREVDFAAEVASAGLDREDAKRALVELLRSLCADALVNVNSAMFYELLPTYGRALAQSERIFHVMFCADQDSLGQWGGHPLRDFYRNVDLASGVITDSRYLHDWLVGTYQLSPGLARRLHTFPAPADPGIPLAVRSPRMPDERPRVFWAGRFARQKRLDLVAEIARSMPEVDFLLWGEGIGKLVALPDNVLHQGAYAQFHELPLDQADAWLYTSAWDGVPSQLLEVAMTGVPIVASFVGGVGEVVHPEHGSLVEDVEDPKAYVRALESVIGDPGPARARAHEMRARLLEQRTEADYARLACEVLLLEEARR